MLLHGIILVSAIASQEMPTMNILILASKPDRIDLSLRVGGGTTPALVLAGHVCLGAPAVAELRDPQGTVLHRLEFTGERLAAGLVSALTWLRNRNIRVDAAVHEVGPLVPNDLILRLSAAMKGTLSSSPANQARESVKAVSAWDETCPQFVHYAIDPGNLDNLVSAVTDACATPPSYCRQNRKVRCDACTA
jgi:hypothetical protein